MNTFELTKTIAGNGRMKRAAAGLSMLTLTAFSGPPCVPTSPSDVEDVFRCSDNYIPAISMTNKGIELDYCNTGNIAQAGVGSVTIANSRTGDIAENMGGDVSIKDADSDYRQGRRTISGNIAESGSGSVIIWGVANDARAEVGDIAESDAGDVIIKYAKVHNIAESGDGDILLCAGARVEGNVSEAGGGSCRYLQGARIQGSHYCQAVSRIPKCE